MLGKDIKISYNEVRNRYEAFRSRCNEKKIIEDIKLNKIKKKTNKKNYNTKEKKCDNALYGVKGKAVIEIIPKKSKKKTFINKCNIKNNYFKLIFFIFFCHFF